MLTLDASTEADSKGAASVEATLKDVFPTVASSKDEATSKEATSTEESTKSVARPDTLSLSRARWVHKVVNCAEGWIY